MQRYEYRVIPAPRRGEKSRGAKSVPERFGVALTHLMNDLAAEGWEYLRADMLPCDERTGLTGTATHYHAMLVFRREAAAAAAIQPEPAAVPVHAPPVQSLDDLIPEPIEPEERTVISPVSPFAGPRHPPAGAAPPLGPASPPPLPNGRD